MPLEIGAETVHGVVIEGALSPFFYPGPVRVGAASHPYAWDISGTGILTFCFVDIEMPYSRHMKLSLLAR